MFFMDKKTAESSIPAGVGQDDYVYVWRYIPSSKLQRLDGGECRATPAAFSIRRDENGVPKEPSASLFKIRNNDESSREVASLYLEKMKDERKFNVGRNAAAGSVGKFDLEEVKKDPGFNSDLFSICESSGNSASGVLLHWDLIYAKDDAEEEIFNVKSVISSICNVFPR